VGEKSAGEKRMPYGLRVGGEKYGEQSAGEKLVACGGKIFKVCG